MAFTASEITLLTVAIGAVGTVLAAIISATGTLGAPVVSAAIEAYKEKSLSF